MSNKYLKGDKMSKKAYVCKVSEVGASITEYSGNTSYGGEEYRVTKGVLVELVDQAYRSFGVKMFCIPETYRTEMLNVAMAALVHGKYVEVILESTEEFSEISSISITSRSF
ncbi:MAG: hypothetical protein AB4063_23520 [Crocosphaera sp.]